MTCLVAHAVGRFFAGTELANGALSKMNEKYLPARAAQSESRMSIILIFMPFAAGYFLSYLFRTINGPIAESLIGEFNLGPRDLGLLTSLYFLTFAAFQIPAGMLIDRYGPRLVQSTLLMAATCGAVIFAAAPGPRSLMVGRALIGLGTSAALVTGLKALATWLPPEKRASGNAWLVMFGGLGAVASTAPLDALADVLSWRAIFLILAAATTVVAAAVWVSVPEVPHSHRRSSDSGLRGMQVVFCNPRFWRIAPLSASVVGAAFALHGLWAARWLAEVEHLAPGAIAAVLLAMGLCLTAGAAMFGAMNGLARHHGIPTTAVFTASCLLFLMLETAVAMQVALPPILMFGPLATFGAITVLSFSMIGEVFPPDYAGRANAALNVLHLGTAFLMQAGIGAMVALWMPQGDGHPPPAAYVSALTVIIALQTAAVVWFVSFAEVAAAKELTAASAVSDATDRPEAEEEAESTIA